MHEMLSKRIYFMHVCVCVCMHTHTHTYIHIHTYSLSISLTNRLKHALTQVFLSLSELSDAFVCQYI
jgi:hypothetical protein